jgi:DUF1365 family protein
MDLTYHWTLHDPGDRLGMRIEARDAGASPLFEATLALRRRAIRGASLASMLARYPLMTAQVIAGIYWQALRLRAKGATVYPHPRDRSARTRRASLEEAA